MPELPKSRRIAKLSLTAGFVIASAVYVFRLDLVRPETAVPSRKVQIAAGPAAALLPLPPRASSPPDSTIPNPLTPNVPKESTPRPLTTSIPAQPPVVAEAVPRPSPARGAPAAPPDGNPRAAVPPAPPPRFMEGKFEGDVVETGYGPVKVTVTILNDHIIHAECPQFPYERRRSQEINESAIPTLIREVIKAQGANIDAVSGATETTAGFYDSLKSSLEKAKNRAVPPPIEPGQ
jgi:uncharacterized protein with FMN-binding domain